MNLFLEIIIEDPSLYPNGFGPTKPGDAGSDLRALEDFSVSPGECKLIRTGIKVCPQYQGANSVGFIVPRSGLGAKDGLVIGNLVGVIDQTYQGELLVAAWNRNEVETGKVLSYKRGDRVCQIIFLPYFTPHFQVVEKFSGETVRGENGFNSTGTQ